MGVIIGILEQHTCAPTLEPFILPLSLNERVSIPQSLSVSPNIIHDGSRNTPFRPIVIRVYTPETGGPVVMMQAQFGTNGVDVSVLANSGGVVRRFSGWQHTTVTEGIFAIRIDVLGIHRQRECVRQLDIYAYIRIGKRKRAETHLRTHVHTFIILKIRFAGGQIDVSGCSELSSGLEDIGFLTIIELNLLHIIERETT